jgi:hypothetical protein
VKTSWITGPLLSIYSVTYAMSVPDLAIMLIYLSL